MVAPTTAAVAPAVAPAEPTKAARVYNFVPEWKQGRPWLRFDALAKAMPCALCIYFYRRHIDYGFRLV
jgi:hypothetical protein